MFEFDFKKLAIVAFGILVLALLSAGQTSDKCVLGKKSARCYHQIRFFEPKIFWQGVEEVDKVDENNGNRDVIAAAVPHHLFAGKLISEVFARVKTQQPKTIILIGPNHYWKGESWVLTSHFFWQTPFGQVEPNIKLTEKLIGDGLAVTDEETLEFEHSVSGLMPYIKYYLPESQVVPLVLKRSMDLRAIENLAGWLKKNINDDAIVIASVDFSHYLSAGEAQKKDQETLTLMQNSAYEKILNLGEDHVDSPPAIVLTMTYAQSKGADNFQVLQNTNSGLMQNNLTMETTSYFTLVFEK